MEVGIQQGNIFFFVGEACAQNRCIVTHNVHDLVDGQGQGIFRLPSTENLPI